jgi:7,8-dihydropterin-6-yl-methyl-4-(beta-D-ribofuranosyl)aminobenzene 5'-phosphate synthase
MSKPITLHCVVDNITGDAASFRTEHGVAFVIETPAGRVLFDTGESGAVLAHNAAQMGLALGQIDALALSHAHYDHTGGLATFFQHSRPDLPLFAHLDLVRERFAVKDGQERSIGLRITPAELAQHVTPHWSAEPVEIFPHVWTSGEITGRNEFEGRSPHHFIRADDGGWLPDPYRDDMSLILEAPGGLVVVCGCCHAGLLNTLAQVRRSFSQEIIAIIGGTHLGSVEAASLEHAIAVLRAINPQRPPELYLNHCTGQRALAVLAQAFGEQVYPCPAGTVLDFN